MLTLIWRFPKSRGKKREEINWICERSCSYECKVGATSSFQIDQVGGLIAT